MLCPLLQRYFFQQLISGVAWCHSKVRGRWGPSFRGCAALRRAAPSCCWPETQAAALYLACLGAPPICRKKPAAHAVHAVQGVCHRDLKLDNALLDRPVPNLSLATLLEDLPRLKICDFGDSKVPRGSGGARFLRFTEGAVFCGFCGLWVKLVNPA